MTTDDLKYNRTLTKEPLFSPILELYSALPVAIKSTVSDGLPPSVVRSGDFTGNFNIVTGYLKSHNYIPGVNGWKFDNVGNLEANTATIRGSIYASSGLIGGWVIDDDGLYYNGSGDPNIRTSATVGAGANGVILDSEGIRGYDSVLGEVFNLHSDGSAPEFSFGEISESIFEINTNAVLRTASTVGDGSADSAGILINNTGLFACEADQDLGEANVRILNDGNAYFKGTINASTIQSTAIYGGTMTAPIITGGLLRTAETGRRTEITSDGLQLMNGEAGSAYADSDFLYGNSDRKYGNGVLGYINNSTYRVPFYINAEQTVADAHFYNRSAEPTGTAEVGDLAVINGILAICTTGGTPGDWESVAALGTVIASLSPSASASTSPSVSSSRSPSISPSAS